MHPARHISISIDRPLSEIYRFASNPENLPKWAAGLSGVSVVKAGDEWICDSPMGRVKVKFAKENPFGVMDHDVTLPSGEVNHNPFRVLSNAGGGEVVFTLYRLPRMSDEDFDHDASLIQKDLEILKRLLENRSHR
ncbi:MAG TPA: hypothetical protein PL182_00205 [Pseudobdellovibrionaceae bacterium]|nr:hypothetical protein [Pseudobdellovibrionaceae bacterium]